MIESLAHFLELHILPIGPLGVFLASVIEEVIAPIPSALVMMGSGFLFISGPVNITTLLKLATFVAFPAALGVSLGSLVIFYISWYGGKVIIQRWGKWVGLSWEDILKFDERVKNTKKDELLVIGGRILPVIPSVAVTALCGLVRMNVFKYTILTFIGMFIRAMVLGAVGWQAGNLYEKYSQTVAKSEKVGLLLFSILVFSCLAFLFFRKYRTRFK